MARFYTRVCFREIISLTLVAKHEYNLSLQANRLSISENRSYITIMENEIQNFQNLHN